jgi:hypothetical protein
MMLVWLQAVPSSPEFVKTYLSVGRLELRTKSSRLKDLLPVAPACLARIESIRLGQIVGMEG